MTAQEVVEKWLKYSNFDPNKHQFNVLSTEYAMHQISKTLSTIMDMDPTCVMSVLYIKHEFEVICKSIKISYFDILDGKSGLSDEDMEMWNILHSDEINRIENDILDNINHLIEAPSQQKSIGKRDVEQERKKLALSIVSVVEELKTCNAELFARGGRFLPLKRIDTHLHVFNSLAECLFAIENAQDALYVCFISCGGSNDGYFGYFMKNNGNIFSVNERVNEAYPGQHKNSRNGRWMEGKKCGLFPYEIVQGSDFDYKGYDKKLMLDDTQLELLRLAPESYIPLMLGAIMINNKMSCTENDKYEQIYVDSLLPNNVLPASSQNKELVPLSQGIIAKQNQQYQLPVTSENVVSGELSAKFQFSDQNRMKPNGFFADPDNIFVKLYGNEFTLNTENILKSNSLLLLSGTGSEEEYIQPEFVGSKDRLDLIAYQQARRQLAEYIRDQMLAEFLAFGGTDAVKKWWEEIVIKNKERLYDFCLKKWNGIHDGTLHNLSSLNCYMTAEEPLSFIYVDEHCKNGDINSEYRAYHLFTPFNSVEPYSNKLSCGITGAKISYAFIFKLNSWKDMIELFGEENIPKCVLGWQRRGHDTSGNNLLSVTDEIENVGTVFEEREWQRNHRLWTEKNWQDYYWQKHMFKTTENKIPPDGEPPIIFTTETSPRRVDFGLRIGFSKRGFAQLKKECQLGTN